MDHTSPKDRYVKDEECHLSLFRPPLRKIKILISINIGGEKLIEEVNILFQGSVNQAENKGEPSNLKVYSLMQFNFHCW